MKFKKRIFGIACCVVLAANSIAVPTFAETNSNIKDIYVSYEEYRENKQAFSFGETKKLTIGDIASKSENAEISDNVNSSGLGGVVIPDNGYASWKFEALKDSSYAIRVKYISAEASSGNMELEFNIDGKIPYSEVAIASFERTYEQEEGKFKKNITGNHVKPEFKEIFVWKEKSIIDSSSLVNKEYLTPEEIEALSKVNEKTLRMAQIFLGALPVMCVYPFLQKYFVKGITVGSVKG